MPSASLPVLDILPAPNKGPLLQPSSAAQVPTAIGPLQGQGHDFLLPESIQHIISTAVQQSLSAKFRPPSRGTSVQSLVSNSPSRDCQEDTVSMDNPDSPVPSHVSHLSCLEEVES